MGYNTFLMPEYEVPVIQYPAVTTVEQATPSASETELIVSINTAQSEELQRIPGIGPVMASKILDYRLRVGVITDLRELLQIDGIGEATFQKISPYFTLEG